MKLVFPENFFTQLIIDNLPSGIKYTIVRKPSSLISSEINKDETVVGLLPIMDLIKYRDLFVSQSFGISFEGSLCNSYIYYNSTQKDISEINLLGDISSVEVLLCKILFSEMYDKTVEIKIATDEKKIEAKNILLTGDKNFVNDKLLKGISIAEEMVDALSLPFVNYVFASKDKSLIEQLNEQLQGVGSAVYDKIEDMNFHADFSENIKSYIKDNISSFIMEFNDQDIEGINQIIRLPYYHGIINDIVEVKFI